jgi:hypothetical protein
VVIEKSAASAQWLDWIDLTSHSLDDKIANKLVGYLTAIKGTCI